MGERDECYSLLEEYLRTAPIDGVWANTGVGGGHPSVRIEFLGGVTVIGKPADANGDAPRMIKAEAAGWQTARLLGWEDLVSATVIRTLELPDRTVEASVQVAWHPLEWIPSPDTLEPGDVFRAAVFDTIIKTTDRSGNNWLSAGSPDRPRLKLIDHGHAFTDAGTVSSAFVTHVKPPVVLAEDVVAGVTQLTEESVMSALGDLLGEASAVALLGRAQAIAASGELAP